MGIFQGLGIAVGLVGIVAAILAIYAFLRSFTIVNRREYDRLKRSATEHQRCQAEWDQISTLDNWAKEIRIASRGLTNKVKVEPEF